MRWGRVRPAHGIHPRPTAHRRRRASPPVPPGARKGARPLGTGAYGEYSAGGTEFMTDRRLVRARARVRSDLRAAVRNLRTIPGRRAPGDGEAADNHRPRLVTVYNLFNGILSLGRWRRCRRDRRRRMPGRQRSDAAFECVWFGSHLRSLAPHTFVAIRGHGFVAPGCPDTGFAGQMMVRLRSTNLPFDPSAVGTSAKIVPHRGSPGSGTYHAPGHVSIFRGQEAPRRTGFRRRHVSGHYVLDLRRLSGSGFRECGRGSQPGLRWPMVRGRRAGLGGS